MKQFLKDILIVVAIVVGVSMSLSGLYRLVEFDEGNWSRQIVVLHIAAPKPPKKMKYSYRRTGPIEVAKVFGRGRGCQDADTDLINLIVDRSINYSVDPKLVASVIIQESQCDQFAVSSKGAIGLMQVMPKIHQEQFDFSKINLFNPRDNIDVGIHILSDLIEQYGETEALRRYQGVGANGNENYVSEVSARMGINVAHTGETR